MLGHSCICCFLLWHELYHEQFKVLIFLFLTHLASKKFFQHDGSLLWPVGYIRSKMLAYLC
jgi:hypothetical protein